MRLFTRFFLLFAALWVPFVSVFAATITIEVGDNYYRGPSGTNTISLTTADDLVFQYATTAFSSHPTMSDSSPQAWPLFQMNTGNRTQAFSAASNNRLPAGTYPFHCTAHGLPGSGQFGTLIITQALAATSESSVLALTLFPNPSKGLVTVQMKQPKMGADYKMRVSNVIGQEVRSVVLKPELTEAGLPVDLSSLPNGIYFYSLLVDGKVMSTKRLVLQN